MFLARNDDKISMMSLLKNFFLSLAVIQTLISMILATPSYAGVWTKERMKVEESVSERIEEVLALTAEFHKIRVGKDTSKTITLANEIAAKLSSVASLTQKNSSVQSLHITKIVQSARSSIEIFKEDPMAKNASSELKDFFKDIVQITQVFDVKKYKIFFCPQDKALWLQTTTKAQNPVNLSLKNCGKPV